MDKLNVFGQPINEAERAKNTDLVRGLIKKIDRKSAAATNIRTCDRDIEECKSKIQENKKSISNLPSAEQAAKKAAAEAAAQARASGTEKKLTAFADVIAVGIAILTMLSLVKLFPMIRDNMDITVVILLVGAPIVLLFMLLLAAATSGERKKKSLKEIGAAIKKFWDEA